MAEVNALSEPEVWEVALPSSDYFLARLERGWRVVEEAKARRAPNRQALEAWLIELIGWYEKACDAERGVSE